MIQAAIDRLAENLEIVPVTIGSQPKPVHYVLAATLDAVSGMRPPARKVHFLSPFDNLIILRKRLQRLFNFDYTVEFYLPASKRIHGYFVLPILYGDQFVGRLDAKAVRTEKTLRVHRLAIEALPTDQDRFFRACAERLREFANFNGCERVRIAKILPSKFASPLRAMLKQ